MGFLVIDAVFSETLESNYYPFIFLSIGRDEPKVPDNNSIKKLGKLKL